MSRFLKGAAFGAFQAVFAMTAWSAIAIALIISVKYFS